MLMNFIEFSKLTDESRRMELSRKELEGSRYVFLRRDE